MTPLDDDTLSAMDALLEDMRLADDLPGISAIIVQAGQPLWRCNSGFADLETELPASSHTLYGIGSVTKLFTAFMLMQLRDAGQLGLEDQLSDHLPEIAELDFPPITLKHLASHTSGLPIMPPMDKLAEVMAEFPPDMEKLRTVAFPTIEEILDTLPRVELLFEPGSAVEYSNLGVALLAHAMERHTDQAYTTHMQENLLRPLGMMHSGFSESVMGTSAAATCYLPFSTPPQPTPPAMKMIAGFTPTGAMWSSVDDMQEFLSFLTDSDAGARTSVLSRKSLLEMLEVVAPLSASRYVETGGAAGVGIGWFLSEIQGHRLAEHGGADPSTAAYVAWVPALDLAGFIATNSGKNPGGVAETLYALLDLAVEEMAEAT